VLCSSSLVGPQPIEPKTRQAQAAKRTKSP